MFCDNNNQNNNVVLMASLALAEFAAWVWAKADHDQQQFDINGFLSPS